MAATQPMTPTDVQNRAAEARKYLEIAQLFVEETSPASWKVSGANAVAAGIAAGDAVCGRTLGYCSKAHDHKDAVTLLARATSPRPEPANNLRRLMSAKSLFQYGPERVTQNAARDLLKYAERLIDEMTTQLR